MRIGNLCYTNVSPFTVYESNSEDRKITWTAKHKQGNGGFSHLPYLILLTAKISEYVSWQVSNDIYPTIVMHILFLQRLYRRISPLRCRWTLLVVR